LEGHQEIHQKIGCAWSGPVQNRPKNRTGPLKTVQKNLNRTGPKNCKNRTGPDRFKSPRPDRTVLNRLDRFDRTGPDRLDRFEPFYIIKKIINFLPKQKTYNYVRERNTCTNA